MEQLAGQRCRRSSIQIDESITLDANYRLEQLESSIYLAESSFQSSQMDPWQSQWKSAHALVPPRRSCHGEAVYPDPSSLADKQRNFTTRIYAPLTNPPTLEHLSDQPAPISDLLPRHNRCHCRAIRSDDLEWSTCRNTISCISQG